MTIDLADGRHVDARLADGAMGQVYLAVFGPRVAVARVRFVERRTFHTAFDLPEARPVRQCGWEASAIYS